MPGWVKLRPVALSFTPEMASKKLPKLNPKCSKTRKLSSTAPPISSTALTICTQVVATIPPAMT